MDRRRIGLLALLWLSISLLAGAGIPPAKQGVTRVKEANAAVKPFNEKEASGILQELARNYKRPRGAIAPSAMLQWARSARPHQKIYDGDKLVHTDLEHGVVAVVPLPGRKTLAAARRGEAPGDFALRYVEENKRTFGLTSPANELVLVNQTRDTVGGTHLLFCQRYQGVPFWGRQLTAHLNQQGNLAATTGYLSFTPEGAGVKPGIPATRAIEIAQTRLAADGQPMTLTQAQMDFCRFAPPRPELFFWSPGPLEPPALAWVLELRPNARDWFRCFISAKDGRVLDVYNATNTASAPATAQAQNLKNQTVTLNTYQVGGTYYMIDGSRPMFIPGQADSDLTNDPKGAVLCLDLRGQELNQQASLFHFTSADNTWTDKAAVSALDYAGKIYDYYKTVQNRNSFDNQGKAMMVLMHVPEKDSQSGQLHGMDNAFWNGSFVSLGDGYQSTTAWANAFDLVTHEFTHAHVQYTANLEYKFQSGALNESFADLGGISLDNTNYLIGEDIAVRQYMPSGALRDMSDPHNGITRSGGDVISDVMKGWQPANMSEYVDLTQQQDNGGVHVNNGITNFAIYKTLSNPAVGHRAGENIFFHALTNYLGKQSNFTDFRIAAVRSAGDLHGADSAQQNAVKAAFDEVGIVEGAPPPPPPDTPPVTGQQYIVMVADLNDGTPERDSSLYITPPFTSVDQIQMPTQLTATNTNIYTGRPMAVDPYGQAIWFVDASFNLRAINPDKTGELAVESSGQWSSVAISPTGHRIALTRNVEENKILILDIGSQTLIERVLTAPTTSQQNTGADMVRFADSLVFIDDQLLVYDCLNSVQSPSGGGTIDFWNVNLLDVDSGQIFAVLPPQAVGVHIMNPIFASTNKSILCVEIYQEGATNKVIGINLSTGDAREMFDNGVSNAFADYSVDDKYMLYNTYNAGIPGFEISGIALGADKISTVGDPGLLVSGAMMPIWFAQGTPPTVSAGFAAAASQGSEAQTTVNIPVILTGGTSAQTVTVDYAVTGGNAIGSGVDYTIAGNRLTFNAGETTKNIALTVVNDSISKGARKVTLALSNPVNAWMADNSAYTYTILEDDQPIPAQTRKGWERYK